MVSSIALRISNVTQELTRRRTIPSAYLCDLEKRLFITFESPTGRLKRRRTIRSKQEYKSQYGKRKAQKMYLEILEDAPQIFVPFVLAVSPESCERFNLESFRKKADLRSKLDFKDDVLSTLQEIARKGKFDRNPLYQQLISSLFPNGLLVLLTVFLDVVNVIKLMSLRNLLRGPKPPIFGLTTRPT
jgi:hypothetical protein